MIAVVALLFCACVTTSARYQRAVAEKTGCPADQIAVTEDPLPGLGNASPASGCGREFSCVTRGLGSYTPWAECTETEESRQRTSEAVVKERLSIETGCPAADIKVDRVSDWKVGAEQTYRLVACGKPFVCTLAAARTECHAALSP